MGDEEGDEVGPVGGGGSEIEDEEQRRRLDRGAAKAAPMKKESGREVRLCLFGARSGGDGRRGSAANQ